MAACMFCMRKYLTPRCFFKSTQIRTKYFVLIPEIFESEPEKNPLYKTNEIPDLNKLTAENCVNAVGKLSLEFESGICRLEEELKDTSKPVNFGKIINAIETLYTPLEFAWGVLKNLNLVKHSDETFRAYSTISQRVADARSVQFSSPTVYHTLQEIKTDQKNLNKVQRRVLDKYHLEGRLNGLELSGHKKAHLNAALNKISKEKETYRLKLNNATQVFSHKITDPFVVRDFPEYLVRNLASDKLEPSRGPWNVTLNSNVYFPFLQHCSDRDLRYKIWHAFNTRASMWDGHQNSNSIHMEEIRFNRRDQGDLLGYKTYADLSMETKMARNVENVTAMITSLKVKSEPKLLGEMKLLLEFAQQRGFEGTLQMWDVPFFKRKQKQTLYNLDMNEVRNYFPFPKVLEGVFQLCHKLFGISIKEAKAETWDSSVSYYKILDSKEQEIASFYLDPYIRKGKLADAAGIEPISNKCDITGSKPVACLIYQFMPPMYGKPSLLDVNDVLTLLKKFGYLLQHSLTTVPYGAVAGLTNVEWDAVNICSNLLSYLFSSPHTAKYLSSHYETNEPLPSEILNKICKARNHMKAFELSQQLYLATLDLELYSSKDFWLDITRKVWPHFMPLPLHKQDAHPCSFFEIFSGEYAAAYYSFLWAEMIAADIFGAFEEGGLDNDDAVREIGMRFKDTFLSYGGGCHSSELFRHFRGRDPSPDALLKMYDL